MLIKAIKGLYEGLLTLGFWAFKADQEAADRAAGRQPQYSGYHPYNRHNAQQQQPHNQQHHQQQHHPQVRFPFGRADRVCRKDDPRHIGVTIKFGREGTVKVRWEDTGHFEWVYGADLRKV